MRSHRNGSTPDPEARASTDSPATTKGRRPKGELAPLLIGAIRAANRPVTYGELAALAGYMVMYRDMPEPIIRIAPGWYALRDMPLDGWQPPVIQRAAPVKQRAAHRPPRVMPTPEPGTIAWYVAQFLADIEMAGR